MVERRCDGRGASGFTWHRSNEAGEIGLRGTTFVEVDESGRIAYARDRFEPLVKPGGFTATLLKAVARRRRSRPDRFPTPREGARDRERRGEVPLAGGWQGASDFKEEALACFDDDSQRTKI